MIEKKIKDRTVGYNRECFPIAESDFYQIENHRPKSEIYQGFGVKKSRWQGVLGKRKLKAR